jgi:2-polyprenyl-6-methoxyphenol hydroxylase-like FAD-dependent oxidoreductase
MRTKIIIIGAGPTGLMAACQLARFDCEPVIIDKKTSPTVESRAMLLTPRSMEIYQQMGLGKDILNNSKPIPELSVIIGGRNKASFNISDAGKALTDFPEFMSFEQFKNERLLNQFLEQTGREVRWNTEFKSLKQQGNEVIVQAIRSINGVKTRITITADFLLACDGASSPVRHALQMDFKGGTYQTQFFVADVKINWRQPSRRLIATPGRNNFCAFFPMYGDNWYRILGTLPKGSGAGKIIGFDELRPLIADASSIPMHIEHVNWFSVYRLHHRCMERFRNKNCFFLGDAAHIHSPAGGQGMNTGLQDAHNLAWKLALVTRGKASAHLLDTYHNERYPFAQWLLRFTDRLFEFMTANDLFHHLVRKYLLPFFFNRLSAKPSIKKKIFMTLSQLWYSNPPGPAKFQRTSQKLKFRTGDRCPYVMVNAGCEAESIYEQLKTPAFVLLMIGDFAEISEKQLPLEWVTLTKVIKLPLDLQWQKLGVSKNLTLLIRPDQYIGLIADELATDLLTDYFKFCGG